MWRISSAMGRHGELRCERVDRRRPFDFATVSAHADRALCEAKRGDGFACEEGAYVERFGAVAT